VQKIFLPPLFLPLVLQTLVVKMFQMEPAVKMERVITAGPSHGLVVIIHFHHWLKPWTDSENATSPSLYNFLFCNKVICIVIHIMETQY
jgi:hypothetical protein